MNPTPAPSSRKSFATSSVFWASLAFVAWACFVLLSYLNETGHVDYFAIPVMFLDRFASAHFWTAAMIAVCIGVGAVALRLAGYRSESVLEGGLLSFGVGQMVATALLIAAGPLGAHGPAALRIGTGVVFALAGAALYVLHRRRSLWPGVPRAPRAVAPFGVTDKAALALVGLIFFITWVAALMPPSRPDPLIDHLPRARDMVERGWGWPGLGGYHNARVMLAWAWALGGTRQIAPGLVPASEVVCALWGLSMAAASLGAMALWLWAGAAPSRWPLAAAMLAACPVFQYVSDSVQLDVYVLFHTLMGAWLLFRWRERRRWGLMFLSALFLGYAVGCKPLAVYAMPAAAAAMGLFCLGKNGESRKRRLAFFLVYLLLLFVTPGYTVSNFVCTGNPLTPFAGSYFPSWHWPSQPASPPALPPAAAHAPEPAQPAQGPAPDDLARKEQAREQAENDFSGEWVATARFGSRPLDWLLLSWNVTVSDKYPNGWGNVILPSFLMLAPLLLLARGRDKIGLLVFCGVYFAVWSTQPQHIRYGLSGLALLAVLFTAILRDGLKPPLRVIVAWLCVLLPATLVTGAQFYEWSRMNELRYLVGRESRDDYLKRSENHRAYRAFLHLQDIETSSGKSVYARFFGEAEHYHCAVRHVADDSNLNALRRLRAQAQDDPARGLALLRREGFTHVLFNHWLFGNLYLSGVWHGASPVLAEKARKDAEFFGAMAKLGMSKVYDEEGVVIFELAGGKR